MRAIICSLLCGLGIFAASEAVSAVSFTFEAQDQGAVTGLGVVSTFTTTVRNTGTVTDTYTVTMVKDIPPAWACSLCEGTVCYPPFVLQISFSLSPGAETNVDVDLTPLSSEGTGTTQVTVTSLAAPQLTVARDFQVVTTGVDVLLVDGDGGQELENWFAPALEASPLSWARWPRAEAGALGSLELDGFTAVVWFADGVAPALDDGDRAALAYYVQHGGSLLLCGQDLAQQACDPASPWYSPQAAGWFSVVLGVSYAGPAAGATGVAALAASPFARTFAADLNGAGGAANSVSPDALTAVGSGALAHVYGSGAGAAMASTWGAGRSFVCGYALESAGPTAARDGFLSGFLDWAQGLPSGVGPVVPAAWANQPQVAPNPFNPSTTVSFEVAAPGPVQVDICDLRGRHVRGLLRSDMDAGPVALVWDGRADDGSAVPSGLYIARVAAGDRIRSVKMMLAK